jgi:hypothetical protein
LYQRNPKAEWLSDAHQGVVDGCIAMRVIVTHHVAHHFGALARLGIGIEVLLPHRVKDSPLDGLEAVTHVGQCPRRDYAERVVEIPGLSHFVKRNALRLIVLMKQIE